MTKNNSTGANTNEVDKLNKIIISKMNEHFDIIIVGAGPSGCACALSLQNSGLKIALIDKDNFPRRKTCGDVIPGGAFKAINYINPKLGDEMRGFSKCTRIRKTAIHGIVRQKIVKKWKLFSYNCKRYDFDNQLLDLVRNHTSVAIIEKERVKKISPYEDVIHCFIGDMRNISAKLIIGCDGSNSIVKRELLPLSENSGKNNTVFSVTSYFKGVQGLESDQNEMFYIKKYPSGYFWIFPLENGLANVGLGMLLKNKSQRNLNIKAAFEDIIENDPIISNRFKSALMLNQVKGAFLPLGGKRKRISGNSFMLCGDAASLINPLTGSGIDNAIWSGIYAAEKAVRCFNDFNFSANSMLEYDKTVNHYMGNKLRRNFKIMRLLIRFPWIINVIFKFS